MVRKLIIIASQPLYKHTISEKDTTFIASYDGQDFYHRNNGMEHIIDIRYSEDPSDYTTWPIGTVSMLIKKDKRYLGVFPKFIVNRAMNISRKDGCYGFKKNT